MSNYRYTIIVGGVVNRIFTTIEMVNMKGVRVGECKKDSLAASFIYNKGMWHTRASCGKYQRLLYLIWLSGIKRYC